MNRWLSIVLAVVLAGPATAQKKSRFADVVKRVEAVFEPAQAKPGDTVTWRLTLEIIPGWHTYPTKQTSADATQVNAIRFPSVPGLEPVGEVIDPPDPKFEDNPLGGAPLAEYEGTVVFEQKFRVTDKAANGPLTFGVTSTILVCATNCLPPERVPTQATLTISGANSVTALASPPTKPTAPVEVDEPTATVDSAAYAARMGQLAESIDTQQAPRTSSIWGFLLQAMFWGGVSLLTPCVFPMIPITVSYFLKQSEKNHTNPIALASVYCGTIILVLGLASLTLLKFFTELSINPWMNLFLGSLFIALALSLFGMFELTLPASFTRFTSSREGQGGYVGTVFMALTFTVVSFTCVAPFLGGFGGMAASGQFSTLELVLGSLAFAATFAGPFFILALFPSLIRKLPKSGGWLHVVKVVMGFVELAAALKFFRTAELIFLRETMLLTYELTIALWIAICIVCGLYLFKLIQIGEDEPEEAPGISVPRLLWGMAFVALAFYISPAMFTGGPDGGNQRPRGTVFAWIDSFILPDSPADGNHGDLPWTGDLARALEAARARNGRVFIDFTGETCTNCKLNERNVFTRGDVKELFKKYQLVQLYTDKVPERHYPPAVRRGFVGTSRQKADAEINREFQSKKFGSVQLPLYVILKPTENGRAQVVSLYDEGKISNDAKFIEFLKAGLES